MEMSKIVKQVMHVDTVMRNMEQRIKLILYHYNVSSQCSIQL